MTFLVTCNQCSKKDPEKVCASGGYIGNGVNVCQHLKVKERIKQYVWVVRN